MALLLLGLAIQGDARAELLADWKERFGTSPAMIVTGTMTRDSPTRDAPVESSVKVFVSRADPPAVLMVAGDERTRVTADEAAIVYPRERLAYVYDLTQPRNIPWQTYFLLGLTEELERHFTIEGVRRPGEPAGEVEPDPETPRRGGHVAGSGRTPPRKTQGAGPLSENLWVLSLVPVSPKLKSEIEEFTVYLDPKTLREHTIDVRTPSESIRITVTGVDAAWEPSAEALAADMEGYRIKRR